MKIMMWFSAVGKAAVQGETNQYVVDYRNRTCTCPDHLNRHRACKHVHFVLDELLGDTSQSGL